MKHILPAIIIVAQLSTAHAAQPLQIHSGVASRTEAAQQEVEECLPPFCYRLPSLYPEGKGPQDYQKTARR